MNYNAKPYVPVFSPPGQYMACIPSPNAAHLPTTSLHFVPIKCSQGMIQTSPSNQYKPMLYSTPPPPPPPWAHNFHSHPMPTAAAIPVIGGQTMAPSYKNNSFSPRFLAPLLQENRKTQPGCWDITEVQSPESVFKQAALRNGIRVEEETPQKGKAEGTTTEKKYTSHAILPNNQEDDNSSSPCDTVAFTQEQDKSEDSLAVSCRDIHLPLKKTDEEHPEDESAFNHTCSEQTISESSSSTQLCAVIGKDVSASDDSNLNEPEDVGRKIGYPQLNPEDLWDEHEGKRLDIPKTAAVCHLDKQFFGACSGSFNGDFPRVERCDSELPPSLSSNTNAVEEGHGNRLEKTNLLNTANEVLVEDFVLNAIFCAVNSLLQECGKQNNAEFEKTISQEDFDLSINCDGQEDETVVNKATELSMDTKVNNDGVANQLKGKMDHAFVGHVLENIIIDSENISLTNDCEVPAETVLNQTESLLNSEEVILNPKQSILNPDEKILSPVESTLNPTKMILNPNEPILKPVEAISNPTESILNPAVETISNPNKSKPNSAEMILNTKESMSNLAKVISNPNELIPKPSEMILNLSNPDKTVLSSTERVLILSEPVVHTAEEISSNNLHDPVKDVSLCKEENTKSPENQEVEDLFIKLALKKGIKVGRISPPSTNELDCVPESSERENIRFQKDEEVEDLFVRRALQKGIKVGRTSPTNTNVEVDSYGKEKVQSPQDEDMEDLFVQLALRKGIKVGNVSPINETIARQDIKDTKIGEEFEKRALRNGIRLEESFDTKEPLNGNTTCYLPGAIPDKADKVLKSQSPRSNRNKAFPDSDWLNSVTTPMVPGPLSEGTFGPNVVPPFAHYNCIKFNTLVNFDTNVQGRIDRTNIEPGYKKMTTLRQESFEELAKRNGIRVGETLKTKVDSQTQTENSVQSQDTQTVGLVKVRNVAIQVDVTAEAFKAEYDEWMQEELRLIDPKASSFRELFLLEEEARTEAERRLAVEMDENVKAQRNTKILIDELKEQLANKDEAIEKLNKELKSLKKQKDNEIKRLAKEVKQKDEDLKTTTHANSLKDVVIENMREITKEQNELVEKMEEKLKAMEREMENERKRSESLFKIESSRDISQQPRGTDEWQVVKGRHGTKATMKPKSLLYHQMDGLSGFDDKEYEKYNSRPPLNTLTCIAQGNAREEIQSRESLTSKNESCVPPRQDVPLNLSGTQNNVASDNAMATAYNQQSASGDCVIATGCTLGHSLPPPGMYMPSLPRELHPVSVGTSNTSSALHSPGTNNGTPNIASVFNSNGSYNASDTRATTLTSGIVQQELPRVPYSTPGSVGSAAVFSLGQQQQVLPGNLHSASTVTTAMPASVATNHDLPRAPYPTPAGSSCDTPLPPPGITVDSALRQVPPVVSPKNKTTNKFSSFDKLMEALRDSFPGHSRPSLMVYLKKAKEAFGSNGFKGKQISEIVDKVAQVIDQE